MPVPHPSPYALRPASHPPKYIPQYTFPYFSGFGLLPACSLVKFILNAIALSQPEEREASSTSRKNYGHTISRAGDWDGHGRQGKVYWGSQGKGCWSD
ncbi:rna-binding protein [Moniliophthora roreri]|nr:rna-binding protein [Moniliophthora roreri]